MGNRNSSRSKVHGQEAKANASTNPRKGNQPIGVFRDENMGKPKAETPRTSKGHYYGVGGYSEQQSKILLDNDDTFNDFIRRAKKNIRTVSHIGQEHVAPAPTPSDEASNNTYQENQNNQFSNYIQRAKKKLRATSTIRRYGSYKSVD